MYGHGALDKQQSQTLLQLGKKQTWHFIVASVVYVTFYIKHSAVHFCLYNSPCEKFISGYKLTFY